MTTKSREIHLVEYPNSIPAPDQFQLVEQDVSDPGTDEVLVRNRWMSVDPAMRPRLSNGQQPLHQVIGGGALGTVIASNHSGFKEGDIVQHGSGWREYHLSDGSDLESLEPAGFPETLYMHVLGTTGFTAWGGMLITGKLQEGENVFVSAAAGAVGSVAAQVAKLKGCYTIGSTGSNKKCAWLRDVLGLDAAINYREGVLRKNLKAAAPNGLDIYFDNVGGDHLDAALPRMNTFGRIPICGMISAYNNFGAISTGVTTLSNMVYQRIVMQGFVVWDFNDRKDEFLDDMRGWLRAGKLHYEETIHEGIEAAPDALIGLFTGQNTGKMLVKLT